MTEQTALSARLRRASSSRRGDRICLLAADEIERLTALTKADPNDERLIADLRRCLATTSKADWYDAMTAYICRRDIQRILEVLDPQDEPAESLALVDRNKVPIPLDGLVQIVETQDIALRGALGKVVGFNPDTAILNVRLDGEVTIREVNAARVVYIEPRSKPKLQIHVPA